MKSIQMVLVIIITVSYNIFPQIWIQTPSTPEGGGVTDMLFRESNQHLFVTTASYNWPNGEKGGIRRSTDDGATWINLIDAYNARTIIEGPDGNLYASIWPYPSSEGLYRSTDNGNTWGSPLLTVPTGNNIFSIALNPTTNPITIFAGTRNGPLRSTNYGVTWTQATNGIPANSWVRDIEVDSGGYVIAATTNGAFVSTNNGDSWQQITGLPDTVTKVIFDYPLVGLGENQEDTRALLAAQMELAEALRRDRYLYAVFLALFVPDKEISGSTILYLMEENLKRHGVSTFPREDNSGGGYYESTDNGKNWTQQSEGLPPNPKCSALTGAVVGSTESPVIKQFIGLFENTNGGARIFKRESIVSVENKNELLPKDYALNQNYPNPFNPSTKISFGIPNSSFVTLKVYDLLGNEVATLVNEEKPAGSYEIEFNASKLSSGVYVYKLFAGSYVSSKKMVVLK